MEVQGVSCTTCTKKQSVIMAYLYRKNRSPFWYIQYVDSDRRKHDKSTGFRADDPNDTVKTMGEAVRMGHADANPIVSIKIRREKSAKKPELTDQEIVE